MKSFILLLFFFPAPTLPFCICPSVNLKQTKEVKKQQHQALVARGNRGNEDIAIKASTITAQCDQNQYPLSWPLIRRTVGHYEIDTMEWILFIDSDPQNCIAIMPVQKSFKEIWDKKALEYVWIIRPLTPGAARLKIQYHSKASNQVEDEKTITITIS